MQNTWIALLIPGGQKLSEDTLMGGFVKRSNLKISRGGRVYAAVKQVTEPAEKPSSFLDGPLPSVGWASEQKGLSVP